MAEKLPIKLTDLGAGQGALREFETGDTLPKAALPALVASDVGADPAGTAEQIGDDLWAAATIALGNKQNKHENLTALSALAGTADRLPYFAAPGALSLTALTAQARTLLAATTADAQRTALGLGTAATKAAQTSPLDTAPGALMQVGAFGVGAPSVVGGGDLSTWRTPGLFFFAQALNAPSVGLDGYVLVEGASTTHCKQTFSAIDNAATWSRLIINDVAQSWIRQDVEYGVNANGEYWRYPGGLQVCVGVYSDGYEAGVTLVRDWPAAFSANTMVGVSLTSVPEGGWDSDFNSYANYAQWVFISTSTRPNPLVIVGFGRY